MNKDLKSILTSVAILLLYVYATAGILKLLGNKDDNEQFEIKVKLVSLLLFIFSFVFIVSIYHIVGPFHTEMFYKVFIGLHFIYLLLGTTMNALSKD